MIFLYLAGIVAANLSVAYFGPSSTIINAFLFIGLDMTVRDALHERWKGKNLWLRMFGLILLGAVISYILNKGAGIVAMASVVAFAVSESIDAGMYHLLGKKRRAVKINGSNVMSAAADSIIFPTIAFGALMPHIVLGQFLAKVLGGFVWSIILKTGKEPQNVTHDATNQTPARPPL